MKSRRLVPLLLLLALVIVAAVVLPRLDRVEVKHRVAVQPEARANVFLAAQRLLAAQGDKVDEVRDALSLRKLPAHGTLLVESPWALNEKSQREHVLDWVRRGGHLMLALTEDSNDADLISELGIVPVGNIDSKVTALQSIQVEGHIQRAQLDYAVMFKLRLPEDAREGWEAPLEMAVKPVEEEDEEDSEGETVTEEAPDMQAAEQSAPQMTPVPQSAPQAGESSTCQEPDLSGRTFILPKDLPATELEPQIETHPVFARWQLGQGWVTVGNLHTGGNEGLLIGDHASLFVRLATIPGERRSFHVLLDAPYPSLAEWLWKHATEALIALALLIAAVLWRCMPRFGAVLPEPPPARPGLREHLAAVGDFLLRERNFEALLAPLREDVTNSLKALRGRHPEIENLAELGARIGQLDPREVRAALTPHPADAQEFRLRSRTLIHLQRCCRKLRANAHHTPLTISPEGNA